MDDSGAPTLGVGFAIETGSSFEELARLQSVMDSAEAKIVAEAAKIERATGGMIKLGGATAQVTAFGSAATRELENTRRASASAEKAGEGMVRQLQRQIETYGKTAAEIRNMRAEQRALAAEQTGNTSLAGEIRALNAEMMRLETGTGGVTNAAVKNRMAMQGASYQVQDFVTQVSMGANPVNAFAVQGAQLAGQFSNVEGKAGNVARFFMGPWGLAITAGLMLLGPLVGKLFEQNHALDDAVEKLKKDARETELTAQAKDRFKRSQEGVTAAVRDSTDATRKSIEAQRSAAEQANITAKANLANAFAVRADTEAELQRRKAMLQAELDRANAYFGERSTPAMAKAAELRGQVAKIEQDLAKNATSVTQLEARVQETRIGLAEEAAKRLADPMAKINKQYDDQIVAASNAARAQIAAGKEVTSALTAQFLQIERNRQKAVQAEQDRQQAHRQTAQIGREIDMAEARRIAESIGARITSERRSYEEQKKLYDKYMAFKAGRGPWAALAAAPGTSDHEVGNALDIAKTAGMSLSKIRAAFREAGVGIKQLFDEGDHFHIAWRKGADTAAAASKKLADVQTTLARQFDPVTAAAIEYRDALKSIADAKLDPETSKRYAAAAADAFRKARAAAFELPSMPGLIAESDAKKASDKAAEEFSRNVLQPIRDEIALYGLVGVARAAAALELEKESFLAKQIGVDVGVATQRWQEYHDLKARLIGKDAAAEREIANAKRLTDDLGSAADEAQRAADAMSRAFGRTGNAIGDVIDILGTYSAKQNEIAQQAKDKGWTQAQITKENGKLQLESMTAVAGAAKNLFKEHSAGYEAMAAAEKAFALVQTANTAVNVAAGAAKMFASLGPWAFPAVAAMVAVMAGFGFSGGSSAKPTPANEGTGTVFGDSSAKSDSLKNAIDALREVDTLTSIYAREMTQSLRSIDSQIGNFASVLVRYGDINASAGVQTGFKTDAMGKFLSGVVDPFGILSKIPLIGGIFSGLKGLVSSLFGSTTKVTGNGLFGGPQSVGSILGGGFDASYFSDIEKTKKFFGITTGHSYSTQYGAADPALEQQFTLILRSFSDAIAASADPLGEATEAVQARLNGFVVNIGKIDLKGLTGDQIQDKLTAIFGAAADGMANAAFPGIQQFQKVGEGAFETLVRVASTVDAVSGTLNLLGQRVQGMGIAAKLGLVDQFESVSALTNAAESYFNAFYSKEEQNAARLSQLSGVFVSLGLTMPATLSAFRQLVEAQDLSTAAGQATYATLLQLAPAFADLNAALADGKSAADIASERADLERQLLELKGDKAALRALDLARIDASNRAIQEQIWAIQDAQEAAKAADDLRQAWVSVGDSIMDEVKRIRGLDGIGGGSFASLQGQFNAANAAARGGDMDAAKSLPQLSQALLTAAQNAATSRQELDRIRAQTAAALEATYGLIGGLTNGAASVTTADLLHAAATAQNATAPAPANDDRADVLAELRDELAQMRADINNGNATIASNTGRIARKLDDVTQQSGGDAISTVAAA